MKKIYIALILLLAIFMCSCSWLDFIMAEKSLKEVASDHLELPLEDATVLAEWDNHGGFHGDGETFVKMSCADGFEENLNSSWRSLPLEGAAYEYFYVWGGFFEHPETGERMIPEVESGYWYFKSTGAMNWEFALYDCNSNILYFYIYDA